MTTVDRILRFELPGGVGVDLEPTVLVVAMDGVPHQVLRVRAEGLDGAIDLRVTVRSAAGAVAESCRLTADAPTRDVLIPEPRAPLPALVEIEAAGETHRREAMIEPVRRWTVFFVNHSHTDIGFTHPPSEVADIHTKNLEQALLLAESTEGWPDDARFRWTCESSWQVQHFLRGGDPARCDRLARAVNDGTVEVEALYIHSYFDLLSREQLVRSVAYAQWLRDELGISVTSAMISDVPGAPWSLVEVLVDAGVRYLSMAPNNFMAPFLATTGIHRPFWWQGPAGGRVLVWYTGDPSWAYIEGARFGFWDGIDVVEQCLPGRLAELAATGYPFDAVQIQLGSDNRPLRLTPARIAREWNRRYVSPRIRMATPTEFFRHIEQRSPEQPEVHAGEWQSSWSQTTLHYPHEATLSRRNHYLLETWERLAVMADLVSESYVYPLAAIASAYEASLLFDEHSGPKGIWVSRGNGDVERALTEGYDIFERATGPVADGIDDALRRATTAMASGDNPEIVVWNSLGWERGGTVEVELPDEARTETVAVVDGAAGEDIPCEVVSGKERPTRLRFRASGVPAMGTKRYRVVSTPETHPFSNRPERVRQSGDICRAESKEVTLEVDACGRITYLLLDGVDRNLVDPTARWALNQLVRYRPDPHGPEAGGSFTADRRLFDGVPIAGIVVESTWEPLRPPECSTSLAGAEISTAAVIDGLYQWESRIRLRDGTIEIDDRLTWLGRPDQQELLYVAVPWALENPVLRHAGQFAVLDPVTQSLSGGSLDFSAVQGWVRVGERDGPCVVVSSRDLALVDVGGINHLAFHRHLRPERGHLMFRAATGQGVHQEETSPFGQDGAMNMRFAIRPARDTVSDHGAHRFGEEQCSPLRATWLRANNPGFWSADGGSFVALQSATAMITGLKRAESGDGYIVRVWESCGERSLCTLSFPMHEYVGAWRTTVAEADLGRAEMIDGVLRFELGPYGIATFRCVLGR